MVFEGGVLRGARVRRHCALGGSEDRDREAARMVSQRRCGGSRVRDGEAGSRDQCQIRLVIAQGQIPGRRAGMCKGSTISQAIGWAEWTADRDPVPPRGEDSGGKNVALLSSKIAARARFYADSHHDTTPQWRDELGLLVAMQKGDATPLSATLP